MDKSAVIEQALLHHLRATREIPEDFLVPPRLVVPAEVGERMMARIQHSEPPNAEMRALFELPASPSGAL